jgi:hypothetical protein
VSLHGCPAGAALAADGLTGYALRQSLAAASGVPVSDVVLLGARCTGSAASYVTFLPTDPINSYFPSAGGGSSRRLGGLLKLDAQFVAGARYLQSINGSTLIDTQVSSIPTDPTALTASSTGLAVVPSLSAASNIAARIAAMAGAVPASIAAVNASLSVNATSLSASLSALASTWAAATGQAAADVNFGVQSVAEGSPPSTPSQSTPPLALIVTLPVVLGALLAVTAVAVWRRTHASPKPRRATIGERLPQAGSYHGKGVADGVVVTNSHYIATVLEAAVVVAVEDPIAA